MQTRDHILLGRYLLDHYHAGVGALRRRMFLFGCVEPDFDPFTYARGSLRHRFMGGHDAENMESYLPRLLDKLRRSGVHTPRQWFRLGTALHYLADKFTFAHNRAFTGGAVEHGRYEKRLHEALIRVLCVPHPERIVPNAEAHRRYLAQPQHDCRTDLRFIFGTALALCDGLNVFWNADGRIAKTST